MNLSKQIKKDFEKNAVKNFLGNKKLQIPSKDSIKFNGECEHEEEE